MNQLIRLHITIFCWFFVVSQIVAMMGVPMSQIEISLWHHIAKIFIELSYIAIFNALPIYVIYKLVRKFTASANAQSKSRPVSNTADSLWTK